MVNYDRVRPTGEADNESEGKRLKAIFKKSITTTQKHEASSESGKCLTDASGNAPTDFLGNLKPIAKKNANTFAGKQRLPKDFNRRL
ncbi:hypothetical protein M514_04037 [Trichuris suis]|uniref:Uncharacterized protein n=1 Tax=Trichuris suis TaxID=68888 RepID=A0A085NST3_9BILA|nr:hypothetical protein M513_04037 [Trichuris suis]KFD72529.1 hypothetical protein M514_04037 [Trichuris suis]